MQLEYDQFYIDDKQKIQRYFNRSAIGVTAMLLIAMAIKMYRMVAIGSICDMPLCMFVRWISHLVMLSSQLTFGILYAYIGICIWRQYRALNQTAMQCSNPTETATPDEYPQIHRWPRLHDDLVDPVALAGKCFTIPVS